MGEETKKRMTISIMGVDYQILTDDDPQRVGMIATFVNKLIRETKQSAPYISNMSAAILAALNLSEELYRIKDELEAYKERDAEYQVLINYKDKLTEAMQEIEENEVKNKVLQNRIERVEMENEEITELLDEYKTKFNTLRTEYEMNKRTMTELQNKLLENQIELVKVRKSLLNFED
ncbi:MAG: cell division protein ZapA [Anaerofustis sp.]